MMNRFAALCLVLVPALAHAQGPNFVNIEFVTSESLPLTQPLVATVEPYYRSSVASQEAGRVEERFFEEGQTIKIHHKLVKLDTELLDADRLAIEAEVNAAEATITEAKARLRNAERERNRLEPLFERKIASEDEYEETVAAADVAAAAVKAREAIRDQMKAKLNRVDVELRRMVTTAPFAGVISRRLVEKGEWIEQGQAICELLHTDKLYIRVNVPEVVINRVQKGDEVKVTFDALAGDSVTAKVDQIWPQADLASRTFPVRLVVNNKDGRLKSGFFGRAQLTGSMRPETVVPRDAIVTRGADKHVVAFREGKSVVVPVKVQLIAGNKASVRGAIKPGELVVIRGNEKLRTGMDLIPLNQPTPPASGQVSTQPSSTRPTTQPSPTQPATSQPATKPATQPAS